ncbi:MAG TPA: lamin tail domain-containing protein [Streptosporangiaceae bacterium]|nr:lamin tail domain-containing protein [Streptosporangiaceae bacterium]
MFLGARKLAALTGAAAITTVTVLASVTGVAGATAPPPPSPVKIYKVYYNPPGPDTRSNAQLNREYVELTNRGRHPVSLTGWTLRDRQHHIYRFRRFALRPGKVVLIHTGRGRNNAVNLYWGRRSYVWNNTGDTATVRDAHGATVDTCGWNGTSKGYVFC